MLLNCLLLAIPISLDCFGIGMTYGIKNTYITPIAKIIIFSIFFIVTSIAVSIGTLIIEIFSLEFANIVGVILLVLMGLWMIYQSFRSKKKEVKKKSIELSKPRIYKLFIKPFGLTIQIIKNPSNSDLDHSNHIDAKEALYLGLAISIDAFCAGVGCSAIGITSFYFPLFIAIFHILFLTLGSIIGQMLSSYTKIPDNIWSIISGILLITIGISKLF